MSLESRDIAVDVVAEKANTGVLDVAF